MGTPEFAVPALSALVAACASEKLGEIVGVYTQPDRPVGRGLELRPSPVKACALNAGLPVFQPEKLSLPGEFEKLAALRPDLIAVVAFGQILRQNVLDLPRLGCLNVHSSLLPRWRGAAPINWAILGGDAETGVTVQKMVLKLDAGDVLHQIKTPIGATETAGELHDRLSQMGAQALRETIAIIQQGTLKPIAQIESQVTHASKLTKEMEKLDFTKSVLELDRQIRGLSPWPGSSFVADLSGQPTRIKVKLGLPHKNAGLSGKQGQMFERAGMLFLGASDGAYELKRLQQDGKKEVDAAGFLNGLQGKAIALPVTIG